MRRTSGSITTVWILGVRDGRSYCGDGRSHIFDLKVNDVALGEAGSGGKVSQLNLEHPGKVKVTFDVGRAARGKTDRRDRADPSCAARPEAVLAHRAGAHRRLAQGAGGVIVNGQPAARDEIVADGTTRPMTFEIDLAHSSWIAVRILPSVHTNPVFVEIGGKPIRASRKSAEWCRRRSMSVGTQKSAAFGSERGPAAKAAYDAARTYYDRVRGESVEE